MSDLKIVINGKELDTDTSRAIYRVLHEQFVELYRKISYLGLPVTSTEVEHYLALCEAVRSRTPTFPFKGDVKFDENGKASLTFEPVTYERRIRHFKAKPR
jgi:hypothetical protein